MKFKRVTTPAKIRGLTLTDTIVLLAVVALILIIHFWPSPPYRLEYANPNCVNNLKEIGLGLAIYADGNNGRFPLQPSKMNQMATKPYTEVFLHYQVASNELGNSPEILICGFDLTRNPAKNFQELADSNISYFLNADAIRNSPNNSILSGDRFLENNQKPVKSGLFILTTNLNISWTPGVHKDGGNLLWSDGSVQQTTGNGVSFLIQNQSFATNHLLIP